MCDCPKIILCFRAMIQSTDGFPLNFGFTGEPSLVSLILLS